MELDDVPFPVVRSSLLSVYTSLRGGYNHYEISVEIFVSYFHCV